MSLRTVSLRRRVTLSAIGVLGVVLIGVVLLVDALFAAQSRRDVDTALLEKARVAQQLVKQRVRGAELVDRLEGRGVEVRLVMPDGTVYGNAPDEEVANEFSRQLVDGSKITVYAESSVITAAQARLRRLLVLVGIGALAVTAVAMALVVRRALAPLVAMTTLARSIASGDRGYRLYPSQADNELGRMAAAFDDMLDSLEGSEERTKRFVADAAHELRTPIAGVQAVAEALMQTGSAEERERLNLLLVRESRRAGRLVDDLLALARIEAGLELHRERVDLLALAEAEVARTRLLAPDFDIAAEGESAFVSGDPQRLAQVLANLADNARQATGPSGRVRLRVSKVGSFALLVVSDNGPGVPPEDRERIFDRLVRLDEARDQRSGGSGLGLPIARGVVRAHGGELTCVDPDEPQRDRTAWPTTSANRTSGPTSGQIPSHTSGQVPGRTSGQGSSQVPGPAPMPDLGATPALATPSPATPGPTTPGPATPGSESGPEADPGSGVEPEPEAGAGNGVDTAGGASTGGGTGTPTVGESTGVHAAPGSGPVGEVGEPADAGPWPSGGSTAGHGSVADASGGHRPAVGGADRGGASVGGAAVGGAAAGGAAVSGTAAGGVSGGAVFEVRIPLAE